MTLKQLSLIGTDGVTVTTANSGLDRVVANGSSSLTFDNDRGIRVTTVASTSTIAGCYLPAPNKQFAFSIEITTPTTVPASSFVNLVSFVNASSTSVAGVGYSSAKKIILTGAAGPISVISKNGSSADGTVEPNTKIRIAATITVGTSSTTGAFSGHLYTPGSSTPLFSPTPVSNVNFGTVEAAEMRVGEGSAPGAFVIGARYLQVNDGGTSEPAEWIPAVPLDAVPNQVRTATNTSAVGASDAVITVTWGSVTDADVYDLRWGVGASPSTWTTITGVTSGYQITGRSANTYTVQVRARDL